MGSISAVRLVYFLQLCCRGCAPCPSVSTTDKESAETKQSAVPYKLQHVQCVQISPSFISCIHCPAPPPPPPPYPTRGRAHARRTTSTLLDTHTNMAASVSPLRSSFRICSPLTLHHRCCRAKLRTHRKCESQRRHVHQSATRHAAVVISGTELARQLHREIQRDVEELVAQGNMRPHLGVVLVGDDPASRTYVKNKTRAASILGISSDTVVRPSSVSQEELLELIDKMNRDWRVSGLLVQLPLPEHINERAVCNAIAPEKDVDGFHIVNIGKLCLDQRSMVPATPAAVWEIIKRAGIETVGKNVLVAGRSKNVGMPIAMLLHTDRHHERPGGDATVTIAHRCTPRERLKELTSLADIIIAAAGVPKLITADMIKEGAAVIDVGINRIQDPNTGKLRLIGDVDFEGVKEKAGFITPVPGGVGPMTVAMLMKNTVTAARNALMH